MELLDRAEMAERELYVARGEIVALHEYAKKLRKAIESGNGYTLPSLFQATLDAALALPIPGQKS